MRALYDRAAATARAYGYRYVETPAFESSELIHRTSGETSDVVTKETYTFPDRSGRSLTLRPEGTAPLMRAYLNRQHALGSPIKAYYLETMYRYGRPQKGRFREHRQFGLEIFGADEPGADVEIIAIGDAYLRSFGLRRYRIQVNSIGDALCRPAYHDELLAYLRANRERLRDEHREGFERNPLRVLDCKDEACRAVARDAPRMIDRLCGPCREHFDAVLEGLRRSGLEAEVTPTLVRGLDYYNRTAFEFVSDALTQAQSTLFGGGRYDGLAETLGGPHVPAVGFGMGLERVLEALEAEGITAPEEPSLECFLVPVGEATVDRAGEVAASLREAGVSAATPFDRRPLRAHMKAAERSGARFAVVIGERELADGTVTLRRLSDGHQEELGVDDAIKAVLTQRESS
jgi:histidyl-tRNA synthetase